MSFRSYGQNETLISSIRNIIKDYPPESVFKEFLQNADDAGATRFHAIVDDRTHQTEFLFCDQMKDWQGPAILIYNNAKFKETDFDSLMQIRVGGKQGDDTKIGKHGLGFNSCYHFTDVPSFISGNSIAFLDPQEIFLSQRGVLGTIPENGICGFREKDQLAPFEGIEGIDLRSTFNGFDGTLFRIPLRKNPSKISDGIFTTDQILELVKKIKTNLSSQFLFLRNIETMEISHMPRGEINCRSLWKASITGLDENVRNKRKCVIDSIFQIKIEIIDSPPSEKQNEHWIIVTDSQQYPECFKKYVKQHRLRVSGGIAALLKSSENDAALNLSRRNKGNFIGRMYSFLSLPDTTHLPVHLNGTWAQSSDRGKLLIEANDLSDLDNQKIKWNRHILLNFLPELYCKLLKEVVELQKCGEIELNSHPISKFWPFPPTTRNCPKYTIEYGCKVLQYILHTEENNFWLINDDLSNENDRVNSLFKLLPRRQILELHQLLRNNWDEIEVKSDADLRSLIRSLPIWPTLSDPLQPDANPSLKPASGGHILPVNFKHYRTKSSKIYFDARDNNLRRIFNDLGVPLRDRYSYTFEDVEFPSEYDYHYLNFLNCILPYNEIIQGFKNRRPLKKDFPTFTNKLKKISDLYDYNNNVFRIVFNENSEMFLRLDLIGHAKALSKIGFKNKINQNVLVECAKKIEELQKKLQPPLDLRYRGFILIDHLYKNIDNFELENIKGIRFVPISKDLGKPYSPNHYDPSQVLECFNDVILPKYKEVAWSRTSLIAEDVIPPQDVLDEYPSLGKPSISTVIEHLRYLCNLRDNDEWRSNWAGLFRHNVYEVYKWLEKECSNDEDLDLSEKINPDEPLFLNFNENEDPFNINNWVPAEDLVLNSEPSEKKYVNTRLAKYPAMLKSAGAGEVKRPNFEIHIRERNQLYINVNGSPLFKLLLDQEFSYNNITFIVNGEMMRASRYFLAASCDFFRRNFASEESSSTITVDGVKPNSMRVLLRYLYGQSIDDAIKSLNDHSDTDYDTDIITERYRDLLKLANDFELDHLKDTMELRLSRFVTRLNMEDIKIFAETCRASQLEEFCNHFIRDNSELY